MTNENTIKELEKLKEVLLAKISQVDATIEMVKTMPMSSNVYGSTNINANISVTKPNGYEDYDTNAPFRNKVAFVIRKEDRFLHAREIAKNLHDNEPEKSIDDLIKKVSPALSFLGRNGIIVKVKVGKSNVNSFWGSEKWLDDKKEPKVEHRYDESYISKKSENSIEI